ncbi:hypothetical protein VI817_002854 [Penicillium citrinum]|nr:hypothetical protein VI817_002854 [Penicillium citrinum]
MMGGCIADDCVANIKFFRRVIRRDADGFQNILAPDHGMCPLRRDIKRGDRNTGSVSDGLRFSWSEDVRISLADLQCDVQQEGYRKV